MSPEISTECFAHPSQEDAVSGLAGTTSATGRPNLVTLTGAPVRRTSSRTAKHVALNLEIAISRIFNLYHSLDALACIGYGRYTLAAAVHRIGRAVLPSRAKKRLGRGSRVGSMPKPSNTRTPAPQRQFWSWHLNAASHSKLHPGELHDPGSPVLCLFRAGR